ncbi:MAG: hypothetical protein QXD95_08935 [Nitrososphaeria archaeon]
MNDFLLLFKSTSKPEYRQRILNALAIPSKVSWSTHYNKQYCCDELKRIVFNENQASTLIGKKGLFLFVDMESKPSRFFPLRQFEIISSEKIEDNWNVKIIFENYAMYNDFDSFQKLLNGKLKSLPPGGPFAQIVNGQVFNEIVEALSSDTSFDDVIKEIVDKSDEKCFKNCQINQRTEPAQFFKVEFRPQKGRINYDKGIIKFTPGTYCLKLYYFTPEGAPLQIAFHINGLPSNQKSLGPRIILPRTKNRIWNDLTFEVPSEEKLGYIKIEGEDETGKPIIAPRLEMQYSVRIGRLDKLLKNNKVGLAFFIAGIIILILSETSNIPLLRTIGVPLQSLGAAIMLGVRK